MLLRYHRSKTWKLESLKMCFSTDATTMWHCYKMWKAFQIPASPFERTPQVWRKPAVTVENDERGAAICQDTHAVSFCLVQPPALAGVLHVGARQENAPDTCACELLPQQCTRPERSTAHECRPVGGIRSVRMSFVGAKMFTQCTAGTDPFEDTLR